jgi:agmatine deiminase
MACGLGSSAWESVSGAATMERGIAKWVPGEEGPVSRVWMAWPSSEVIWYDQLNGVQADIARLAKTIAKYTPVRMIVNGAQQAKKANTRIGRTLQPVTLLSHIVPDDMWMRDSGCVFRRNGQDGLECIKLNFNGWGRKQTHHNDARVADQMATYLGMPLIESLVVGEGGGVIQDGEGTLIANESSWVNENRNPGKSRLEIEAELLKVYGASKMIWLPGIAGQDITDDHIDGTFQFFAPGKLVVQMPDCSNSATWVKKVMNGSSRLPTRADSLPALPR